ncbi:MAG: hypothetical protein E7607_00670 [Ruminococcaceae bacterium]|nr:hypothetical protein [Oscillospiraceae bacterium]
MIIKNIKSKIIGIGKTVLMPDESLPISKEIAESAAVKAYVRLGFVQLIEEKVEAPVAETVEETAEETTEAPKPAPKKAPAKAKAE